MFKYTYHDVTYRLPSGDEADTDDEVEVARDLIRSDVLAAGGTDVGFNGTTLRATFPDLESIANFLTLFLFADRGEEVRIVSVDEDGEATGSDGGSYAGGRIVRA